jgi:hypothetical protein
VERVEVLKDGASAIYGTDAIGGVINFILKTDLRRRAGDSASGNFTEARRRRHPPAALVAGKGNLQTDRFNVMAAIGYDNNEAGFQPARLRQRLPACARPVAGHHRHPVRQPADRRRHRAGHRLQDAGRSEHLPAGRPAEPAEQVRHASKACRSTRPRCGRT